MSKVEVMDLTVVCRSFPESPAPEIHREHLLDTIDKIFEGNTHLIVVEGAEGIGKTTLLAQYAKRHPDHVLSLFIKPTSRLAYDPEYLRLVLSEQVHWALHKKVLDFEPLDESFLRTQWTKLQKQAQRNRETFYFIIDGLQDIPKEDLRIQDIILKEILPLGLSGFRFLLAGDLGQLSDVIHKSIPRKSFPLSGFSLDETERYLKNLNLDRQSFEDVHKMCQGVPGYLAIVSRMLQSGADIENISTEGPDNLPDFLAIELRKIETISDEQKKLLAVIAYGRKGYPIEDLARILGLENTTIESFVQGLGFVTIDPQNNEVSFVSEAHRKHAANQLRNLKEEANNLLIDDLLKDPDSNTTLTHLPDYYEQAGRLNEILDYLTPDHFTKVLEHSQSLHPVHHRAELGLMTAGKLNQNEALMRFSMQKSVITELDGAEIWRSEIEARMSLKDYDSAMALAQSTVLKEDRLHLLAIMAKIKREQGLVPEPELMEQIRLLYDQIDQKALGERAVEIASDLICSDPDLAIKMVETAMSTNEDPNALDWAFAKMSIAALDANRDQPQLSDIVEKTRPRIKDPKAKEFSAAVSFFCGDYSAAEVIEHVNKLDIQNRLFFLRHWAIANQERDDATDVIDYSLDLLIKNTPYTPKTRDLREIAMPLPSVSDESKARQLVGRFDSHKGFIKNLGTTEDYVRLQLLLAQTESKYDFQAACNRVLEVYWEISKLDELAMKTECLAWLVVSQDNIDPQGIFESKEGLYTVTEEELQSNIKQLLLTTAEHYHAVRGPIRALAKAKPEIALELAKSLNTQDRRDQAILELIDAAIEIPANKFNLTFIKTAVDGIVDSDCRDKALVKVMNRLSAIDNHLETSVMANALPLINSITDIKDAYARCKACCFGYSFLTKQDAGKYSGLASDLLQRLETAWEAIDVGWRKVDTGFQITRTLATNSPEIARKYLDLTDQIRDEIIMDAEAPALTYLACLRLAIRAYNGLLANNINTEEDMERLTALIYRIPSNGERAGLWGALRCFIHKDSDTGQRIIADHVKPLLQDIADGDEYYRLQVLIEMAPALFCAHQATALEMIAKMPHPKRDEAYDQICEFLLRKLPPSEPYDGLPGKGFLLSYEEAVDICNLLKLMNTDYIISHYIEAIADSLVSKRTRDCLTKQQKTDIADRLESILDSKLPDQQNIKHDGYKIAAQAQVARIRRDDSQVWKNLIQASRNIPNIADQALVLCEIATALPSKVRSERDPIIAEAKNLIDSIPADLDRINRYINLALMMVGVEEVPTARECLRAAMVFSVKANDPDLIYPSQRRIIDLAHKIDPSHTATLALLVDDDPARANAQAALKHRLQLLDLKKKIQIKLLQIWIPQSTNLIILKLLG
ncbi:ATP-binding protein [Candidatus Poribacteria bacterium]|nr:ATP-binding protein [Candidatus Poribacteria bacterium]